MNSFWVKEEEINFHSATSIPKTMLSVTLGNENTQFMNKCIQAQQKLIKSLQCLQGSQARDQGCSIPKYPFVLQFSYNEYIVHLGYQGDRDLRVDIKQDYPYFQQHYQCPGPLPKQSQRPPLPMKLSIQKRRGITFQDQKDTKNIPKNYCKAIITFASKNQHLCLQILKDQLKVVKFLDRIMVYKKRLMNIKIFSSLLQQSDDPEEEEFNRTFRILSQIFVKKYAINYIFNSKIVQHNWHLRYRQQIYKGIRNPKSFSHIKNL